MFCEATYPATGKIANVGIGGNTVSINAARNTPAKNNLDLFSVILLGIVGGIGATIGSTAIYVIAWKLGRAVLLRYLKYARINEEKLIRVEKWFEKHGDKAVFFGRLVPALREMISIPAGILQMKIPKFLLFTFLGSCVYSTGVILAGYYFGVAVFENI